MISELRGKLAEVHRLLRGARDTSYAAVSGDLSELPHIRYVITLDVDTGLPRETAKRLIGTLVGQITLSGLGGALLDWRAVVGLVLVGTIAGIVGLYFSGFLYWLGGRLFGGRALPVAIRAAVAWSELPLVLGAAICLAIVTTLHLADSRLDA